MHHKPYLKVGGTRAPTGALGAHWIPQTASSSDEGYPDLKSYAPGRLNQQWGRGAAVKACNLMMESLLVSMW